MDNIIKETVISQFANSPTLLKLIEDMNSNIDPRLNIDDFYSFVFNVNTAQGFGLDIWGEIVGVDRYLPVTTKGDFFGFFNPAFTAAQQIYSPFNVDPFFNYFNGTPTIPVDDTTFRTMIFAKAYANINRATVPTINFILNLLLGNNAAFVVDGLNMTIRYIFNITITPIQYAIIYQSGVIPKPAGVRITFDYGKLFGFKSAHIPIPVENWPWPFNVGIFNNSNND